MGLSLFQRRGRYVCPRLHHDKARAAIFEWIDAWYQRIRIHDSLGFVSPEAFEATESVGIFMGVHDWRAGPVVPVPDCSVPDCLSILLNPHDPNALFTRQTLNHRQFGGVPIQR